jgi:hypothetical protein
LSPPAGLGGPGRPSSASLPSAFRGTGRPAWLSLSSAAALAAAAAVASGVVAGPAHAQAVTGRLATIASANHEHATGHAAGASVLGAYDEKPAGSQVSAVPVAMAAAAPAMAAAPVIAAGPAQPTHPDNQAGPSGSARRGVATGPASGSPATTPAPSASPGSSKPASDQPSASGSAGPSASPAQPAPPEQPLQFYDSVTPSAIPAGNVIATYSTGRYAVSAAAVASRPTIWIDTQGTDPGASVLDIEPGDATPAMAATWVAAKLTSDPTARARLYTMLSEWPAVQAAIATLPSWMQARVRYWIADPTGVQHMVPGANATQWYWGASYDISTADPGF